MRGGSPTDPEVEAFGEGLRDLGYVEGKNIAIESRNTDGKPDRFSGVAAELVRLKVDVIVAAEGFSSGARCQAGNRHDSYCYDQFR